MTPASDSARGPPPFSLFEKAPIMYRGPRPLTLLRGVPLLALATCGDDEPTALAEDSGPPVTFRCGDGTLAIPAKVPGVLVAAAFETMAEVLSHHLAMPVCGWSRRHP
jgi:hypothetical protein